MGMIGSGFLQNLGPVLQGAGASLMAGGDFTQAGRFIPQFQQAQANQQFRNLQMQQANRQLEDAERKRQQEAAMAEAVRGGLFGARLNTAQTEFLASNPALAGQVIKAQLTRQPQSQIGRFKQDPATGQIWDTTTGAMVTPDQVPGAIPASTGGGAQPRVVPIRDPVKKANVEARIRADFTKSAANFVKQRAANERLEAIAALPESEATTGAQDLAMIYSFMQVLEPGLAVKEGEFANVDNARGIPSRWRNAYNRARTGQRMNAKDRADFVRVAKAAFQKARTRQQARIRRFTGISERSGVDPRNVVTGFEVTEKTPAPASNVAGGQPPGSAAAQTQTGVRWRPVSP